MPLFLDTALILAWIALFILAYLEELDEKSGSE
jgi:hypothetical protein